jgi:hypothetical protein
LRVELEDKLESWRKKVLEVQSLSIQRAEIRAKLQLDMKKIRVVSETRRRQKRHEVMFENVQTEMEKRELDSRENLKTRMALHDQWRSEKRLEYCEAMKKANKAAELRQHVM